MSDSEKTSNSETPQTSESTDDVKYVVLQETNGKEVESWYYFIKYNGNEKALQYLQRQLEKVDMFIIDDISTFDLDLDHFFCERTAKEMIMLEVNTIFHRKFDGKMDMINLELKKRDDNEDMMYKIFEKIGMGQIEDFVSGEDVPNDGNLVTGSDSSSEEDSEEDEDLVPPPEELRPSGQKMEKLMPKQAWKAAGGRRINNKKRKPTRS